MEFFLDIHPPTVTAQEHKVRVVRGKPMFYDTARLKAARSEFQRLLSRYRPETPLEGPVALTVDWYFSTKSHREGAYRMTRVGFWNDDAQVCREEVTKRWSRQKPGIHIKVVSIDDP